MNQSKFSLADLLTLLGALGFGFFCYLSLNFLYLGAIVPSIVLALIFSLLLGGLAFGAKLLKKTSHNFKTCIIWEGILLLLFVVFAILFTTPFSHYFTVSEQKVVIQDKVIANIKQAKNMFPYYEAYANNRLRRYENRLRSVVNAKSTNPSEYRKYDFVNGTDNNTQIENKIFTLRAHLYPSNYSDPTNHNGIKEVATTWLDDAENTIVDWKPIGIVNVINEAKHHINTWKNELRQFYSFRAPGEDTNMTHFVYPLTFYDITYKETLGSPTRLSMIYAIGFYILMLLSYFMTNRHTRYPGLKVIFSTGKSTINEL